MKVTKRGFIKVFVSGAGAIGFLGLASLAPMKAVMGLVSPPSTGLVRPPGAVDGEHFDILCIRCGICLEVCPTGVIVLAGFEDGLSTVSTPKLDPLAGSCEFNRGRCEEVILCCEHCPTRALQPPIRDDVKLGTVELDEELCLAFQEKECVVCDEMCPVTDAITLNENLEPVFDEEKCVGCGTCVHKCPAIPNALTLLPKGEKRSVWVG